MRSRRDARHRRTTRRGPQSSAQSFYLYDTRCGLTSRVAPSASHFTRNTASSGPAPVDNSICEHSDTTKQPDLMGTAPPTSSTTLYDYSSDLTGGYPGGLAADAPRQSLPYRLLGGRHEQPG